MAHPYERTVAELMVDAADGLNYPASRADVIAWFAEHYPDVKASTIRAHIVGLTANDRSRHHYAWLAKRDPLFVRNENGTLTAFEGVDGAGLDDGDLVEEGAGAPPLEFALEAFLEEFLLTNWKASPGDAHSSYGNPRPARSATSWRHPLDGSTSCVGIRRPTRWW